MNLAIESELTVKTIHERLIDRFLVAKEAVGVRWQSRIVETFPQYNTKDWGNYMRAALASVKTPGRISPDKLEIIVICLEKIAGIENPPVV